ncbi:MAG: hypothetical protein Q8K32_31370 [Archangium sp.]|nr:hypothetical protein [Archangium sp.]
MAKAAAGLPGAVSAVAQVLSGLKSLPDGIGIPTAGLADIGLKVGTTVVNASVNDAMKLLSLRTGLGTGSEAEVLGVRRGGSFSPVVDVIVPNSTNTVGLNLTGGGAGWGGIHWNPATGGRVVFGAYNTAAGVDVENRGLAFYQNANTFDTTHLMKWGVGSALGVADTVPVFDFQAPSNTQANQRALNLKVGATDVFYVTKLGGGYFNQNLTLGGAAAMQGISVSTAGVGSTASSIPLHFQSGWALTDDATAESFRFLSTTTFAHAEASIATFRNSNVFATAPVAKVKALGDFELTVAGKGVLLRSPDNTRWRLTISNAGAVVVTAAP